MTAVTTININKSSITAKNEHLYIRRAPVIALTIFLRPGATSTYRSKSTSQQSHSNSSKTSTCTNTQQKHMEATARCNSPPAVRTLLSVQWAMKTPPPHPLNQAEPPPSAAASASWAASHASGLQRCSVGMGVLALSGLSFSRWGRLKTVLPTPSIISCRMAPRVIRYIPSLEYFCYSILGVYVY